MRYRFTYQSGEDSNSQGREMKGTHKLHCQECKALLCYLESDLATLVPKALKISPPLTLDSVISLLGI